MGTLGNSTDDGQKVRFVGHGRISGALATGHLQIHTSAPQRLHLDALLGYFSVEPARERWGAHHSTRRSRELTGRRCYRHSNRYASPDGDRYTNPDGDRYTNPDGDRHANPDGDRYANSGGDRHANPDSDRYANLTEHARCQRGGHGGWLATAI
jgi:hypothetical protein